MCICSQISVFFMEHLKRINFFEFLLVFAAMGTFYYQYWKPFNLSIHTNGRYKLSINPIGNRVYQTGITLGIDFLNSGARIGFVDDILLRLRKGDIDVTYIAALNDLNNRIVFSASAHEPLKNLEYTSFKSFEIAPHSTISKEIFFVPRGHTTPRLDLGEYEVSVYVRDTNNSSFVKKAQTRILIESDDYSGFPPEKSLVEADNSYNSPKTIVFRTKDKVLPERDREIDKAR